MIRKAWWLALPTAIVLVIAYIGNSVSSQDAVPMQQVRVLRTFPHDAQAFSQGLVVEGATLFEGTGKFGGSVLREVELETGRVVKQVPLDAKFFGEGITIIGDRIYQLTWKGRVCIVYDKATFKPLGTLRYTGEGWGITDDEEKIFLSDGTSTIRVLDPATFKQMDRIRVKHGRRLIDNLNELEYINGEIWANVWYKDEIARIDPKTGEVKAWVDCSSVYPRSQRPDGEHVLNGIAYDSQSKRIFVTGKNWPNLFEIQVVGD